VFLLGREEMDVVCRMGTHTNDPVEYRNGPDRREWRLFGCEVLRCCESHSRFEVLRRERKNENE
jgi:hypothetical protein